MMTGLAAVDSIWIWPVLLTKAVSFRPAVLIAVRMFWTVTAPADVTVVVPVPSPMVMVWPATTGNDEAAVRLDTVPTTRLVNAGSTEKFAGVSSSDPGVVVTADAVFG